MKITRIMTASAVALTLAFGTAISASAATFDKDSPEIADGVVIVAPGDDIKTDGTDQELRFDSDTYVAYYKAVFSEQPDNPWTEGPGSIWGGVLSFYIDEDGAFRCVDQINGDGAIFEPSEGNLFKVRYVAADDLWHIDQIEDWRTDLNDCDVQVNSDSKTVTVVFDGEEIPAENNYTVEFVSNDGGSYNSSEFPTEPGEYGVVVTAIVGSYQVIGVNDNATFTIAAPEESESESESESTSESEAESQADESSETESTADTSSAADSSKADSSSKATSTASTTNPGTGAAAAMGILAVAAAGVAVSKKRSK